MDIAYDLRRGDLVFLLSRRIRAHCGDVHTGAEPVAVQAFVLAQI
jgi:hypothetical protein